MAANTPESAPASDILRKTPAESPKLKSDITPQDLREVFGAPRAASSDAVSKREDGLLGGKGLDLSGMDSIYKFSMKELQNLADSTAKAGTHVGVVTKDEPLKGKPVEAPTGSPFDQIHKHYKELTNRQRYIEPGNYITKKDLDSALKARH